MSQEDPLWYKDAIIYQLHVRAFFDSEGDGAGDFKGITQKLDYLQDLGVTAIWLLPFYPSPLKDDGYDIAHYTSIHPDYGTLASFREFLEGAHARGLKVINELVINHTSDKHQWFQRARRSPPGSSERDFYVWSDTPDKYLDARIIFKDFETSNWSYDNVAKAYYWHRFYSHQPDLNFDNPDVWKAIFPVMDFWFQMGIDGMRLDAVPYLFEREGTNCENLPETHEFLQTLRSHLDQTFPGRMLLAEANQWPEDAVAYFGEGNECHMAFHFPLMPRLFMGIHMEDRFPIVDIMNQTPAIPENCQWAIFLRNHDELTLEMVTDEERDYMYRAYADDLRARINLGIRRRLAPLLGNNRRRIELMNGLLFSMPGTPVIYYGDEIGMGDNIYLGDRNGVRTPMQWSGDRNAGFSRANPQKLYLPVIIDPEYHFEAVNVEAQQNNPNSLLWWMKRLISLRRQFKAFSRGSLEFLNPSNRRVLAFLRRHDQEVILVVANLSRFVQFLELDLSEFNGAVPVELFGSTAFPPIRQQPYLLTLGPHSFYWLSLGRAAQTALATTDPAEEQLPEITLSQPIERLLSAANYRPLEPILTSYIRRVQGTRGAHTNVQNVRIREVFRLPGAERDAFLLMVDAEYRQGPPDAYQIPITFVSSDAILPVHDKHPRALIAHVAGEQSGWLCEASVYPEFSRSLLKIITEDEVLIGSQGGEIRGLRHPDGIPGAGMFEETNPEQFLEVQKNISVLFPPAGVLKLYRNLATAPSPEAEMGRFLTLDRQFSHAHPWLAELVYERPRQPQRSLGVLHQYVPHEADAWQFTLDALSLFFEGVTSLPVEERTPPATSPGLNPLRAVGSSPRAMEMMGRYLDTVRLLAQRLAELHLTLGNSRDVPEFAPEEFGTQYQRSLYQSMRKLATEAIYRLGNARQLTPPQWEPQLEKALGANDWLLSRFQQLLNTRIRSQRIRCHGDCHLGQLLFTGKDFFFVDFEGGTLHTWTERRLKRSPLRDVVTLLRSFDFAALSALYGLVAGRGRPLGLVRVEDLSLLEGWTTYWRAAVRQTFFQSYASHVGAQPFFPHTTDELEMLLEVFTLETILVEVLYELDHRPAWVGIPLLGLSEAMEAK